MKKYIIRKSSDLSIPKASIDSFNEITVTTNVPFHIRNEILKLKALKLRILITYDRNSEILRISLK